MKTDINTRADIELLVNKFYEKVQQDEIIGHIFTKIANINWELHLPKMYDFWETILFGKKGFKGNPMEVHFKLNQKYSLQEEHFEQWKTIFYLTLDEFFEGTYAEDAKQKASSIADLMFFKISSPNSSNIPIKNKF